MCNVAGKPDRWGDPYMTRRWSGQKIDAAVTLTMAAHRAMEKDGEPDFAELLRTPTFA